MKNLFDFATKELSQDAFLRWLFENYDDPEIGEVANRLLGKFCDFRENEKVQSLETVAQWCKIDISVWMTTSLNRKVALFLEDKTFSNEHNQLSIYDEHIDNVKNHGICKIFYKTDFVEEEEKNRIRDANSKNIADWKIFDIKDIYSFFADYLLSTNMILSQYAEHIRKIHDSICNSTKPKKSDNNIDLLAWKSYFNNVVVPSLKENGSKYWCGVWKAGQYPYVVLYIKKLGYGERKIPYLEIRSRDCQDNCFKAKILCYGIDVKDIPQQRNLIENIKASPNWECKRLRQHKRGAENYFPKQVGFSRDGLTAITDEEFIELVANHIEFYLQVMKDWE